MKRTILHIGLEKTGTTSIQHMLWENRTALKQLGLFIPETVNPGNNFHLAIASYSNFRSDGLTKQLGISNQQELDEFRLTKISSLKQEFSNSDCNRAVISSEHFQSRLTKQEDVVLLRKILEESGLSNFQILLYLRDPLKITMSHHGMAIKKGVAVDQNFYHPSHPRISQILSFQKTIDQWCAVFGEVNVRLFPEGRAPEVLLEDFLKAISVQPESIDWSKREPRNVNLSQVALEVLNEVNHESDLVRRLSQDRWLFNRLEKRFAGKGITPEADLVAEFQVHFEQELRKIAKDYFSQSTPLFQSQWAGSASSSVRGKRAVRRQVKKLIIQARLRQKLKRLLSPPR